MRGMAVLWVWLLLGIAGAIATAWWSRRIWKRRNTLPLRTRAVAMVVAVAAMVGALGSLIGLVKAFGAIGGESVDPSRKARILAEGISEAMNCTALGFVIGLPSVVVLAFLLRTRGKPSA